MVDVAGNVDRYFFVLEHDFAGDWIWGHESAEVARREGVHDRGYGVGGVCGVEGGPSVYLFLRDNQDDRANATRHYLIARLGAACCAPTDTMRR